MTDDHDKKEEELAFTVATVWREERVSCPHADILQAWLSKGLEDQAAEFVRFHLEESQCPYCSATVEDMRLAEREAADSRMESLKERLLRSTVSALRSASSD